MEYKNLHLTKAIINLSDLTFNLNLLKEVAGGRPMFPAIKANAYGHGSENIAKHLISLGYKTLCVAHLPEAIELVEKGIKANFIILAPTLPENSKISIGEAQ